MEFYKYLVLLMIMFVGFTIGLIVGKQQPISVGVELELQREIYELKNKLNIKGTIIQKQEELLNNLYNKLNKANNTDILYYKKMLDEKDTKIEAMRNELQRLYKEAKENNPYKTYKIVVKQKAGDVVRYKFYWEKEKNKNMLKVFEDYLAGKIDVLSLHDDKISVSFSKGQVTSIECEEQS